MALTKNSTLLHGRYNKPIKYVHSRDDSPYIETPSNHKIICNLS